MNKIWIVITLILLQSSLGFTQTYNMVGGIRLGTDFGVTIKQRVAKKITIEGTLQKGFGDGETLATVLSEFHFPLLTKRVNIFMGGGPVFGVRDTDKGGGVTYGFAPVVGAEVTVGRLNLSYDFKPVYLKGDEKNYLDIQHGISVRYVFVKRKILKKKKKKLQNWWKDKTKKFKKK